jgi:hypothetical protein
MRASPPTKRRSGYSRAKAQNRSHEHISRTPLSGRLASQSSMRECGSERCCWLLYCPMKRFSQRLASASVSGW